LERGVFRVTDSFLKHALDILQNSEDSEDRRFKFQITTKVQNRNKAVRLLKQMNEHSQLVAEWNFSHSSACGEFLNVLVVSLIHFVHVFAPQNLVMRQMMIRTFESVLFLQNICVIFVFAQWHPTRPSHHLRAM
jgi:hypothetical protein